MLILPIQYKHFRGGWGVQNLGKHAYIILERSLVFNGYSKKIQEKSVGLLRIITVGHTHKERSSII